MSGGVGESGGGGEEDVAGLFMVDEEDGAGSVEELAELRSKGVAYAKDGRFEDAKRVFRSAVGMWDAQRRRKAELREEDGEFEGFGEEWVAEVYEMSAQVEMMRGGEEGGAWEAVVLGEKAIAMHPNSIHAHITLGRAQLRFGELDMGIASLKHSLTLMQSQGAREKWDVVQGEVRDAEEEKRRREGGEDGE